MGFIQAQSRKYPYQTEQKEDETYYKPKTDSSDSVLINHMERYNQHLKRRDFGKTHIQAPAARMLSAPSLYLKQALLNEKEEEAAGTASVLGNMQAAGIAFGNQADKMRIKKVFRDTASVDNYIRAGNIFLKDGLTEAGNIFLDVEGCSIVDPAKVTRGDLKMFRYKALHADASMEELLKIRKETNARHENGGRIDYHKLGRGNRLKKQIDRLAEATEINAFETYGRNLDKDSPVLFTAGEKAILRREDSILMARNPAEFAANMALIKKILKHSPATEIFANLDPEGLMTERDVSRLLKGRVKGIRSENIHDSHLLKGGLYAMVWNKKSYMTAMERRRKIAGRGTVKRWGIRRFQEEMMEDEEFSGMAGFTEHAARAGRAEVSFAIGGGKAIGKTAAKVGKTGGRLVVAGLEAAGNEVAAEAVRSFGKGLSRAGAFIRTGVEEAVNTPGRVLGKMEERIWKTAKSGTQSFGRGIQAAGRALGNTRIGGKIAGSRACQAAGRLSKRGIRTVGAVGQMAGRVSAAPFRFFGIMVDATKRWMLRPAAITIGGVFFIQLAIASSFGGMGGSLAAGVIMLDMEKHFNNPDFKTSEEMGFQQRYERSQAEFQAQIDGITGGYAKTLNKKGERIGYGVNGMENLEGNQNEDYKNGVTLRFDSEKSNNLEDILCCVAVVMEQQQADHHKEALELADCFYKSSHTYDYTESSLYGCDSGCETTRYFCNEAGNGYPSTEMRFAPYLYETPFIPDQDYECEVDRQNPDLAFEQYAGCEVTGTCYHNAGDDGDNFGRRKPSRTICSAPEPYWDCSHSCSNGDCSHDCSQSSIGCGGYWYCGGHAHYGCLDGHEIKTCFGHVDMEMNVHMKSLEELFELGGVEVNEKE